MKCINPKAHLIHLTIYPSQSEMVEILQGSYLSITPSPHIFAQKFPQPPSGTGAVGKCVPVCTCIHVSVCSRKKSPNL